MSTSRTFCSGVTRAMTPIPSISASACSSLSSANSAPEIARPSMPSSPAIASAVTAWSPVIMRTWMPAACAVAIAAFAAGRGGSTMPTSASSVRPSISCSRSAVGSKVGGVEVLARGRHHAQALLRRAARSPPGSASLNVVVGRRPSSASGPGATSARASSWSGAPLTKQRTTSRPDSSGIRWNVAISL